MKTINLLLLLTTINFLSFSQVTYVPDDNFETYLEDYGMGNGIYYDDYVITANISNVDLLYIGYRNILDLTGIEDFTSIDTLLMQGNNISSIDLSQNLELKVLNAGGNSLTSIDVTQNTQLKELTLSYNPITSIDLTNNPLLTFLDIKYCNIVGDLNLSQNILLNNLIAYSNSITSLNLSSNSQLCCIDVMDNNLSCLNIKNGNNTNITTFLASNNPLTCVEVDDVAYATSYFTFSVDGGVSYSTNCSNDCSGFVGIDELDNSTNKRTLEKIVNILGEEVEYTPNTVLIYIYSDGTTEKVLSNK